MELATAWITIAANTGGMQRDIRRAVNSAERGAKVKVDADTNPMERSVDRAYAKVAVQSRSAGSRAGREFGLSFSREMKVATAAVALGSLPAVSAGLASVAGALQQVSQAALLVPGGMAAVGVSFGTLKLGTVGVGDAIKEMWKAAESGDPKDLKKAVEAMKDLSPNAKSAVTALGSLHDAYSKVKTTVQDNLFEGTDRGLKDLASKTLPTLNAGLAKTSGVWGETFREILRVGGQKSTVSVLDRIFGDTATAQSRANRAIEPMVSALGKLAATGTGSLPRIADGLTSVSQRFDRFITTTAADGRLNQWIDEGIDGLGHLGGTVLNIGKSFTAITNAVGKNGLLRALDDGSNSLQRFLNSAEGQSKMGTFFQQGKEQLASWGPILQSLPTILNSVYGAFTTVVLPKIASVATFLAEHAQLVKTAAIAWLAFHTVPAIMAGIRQRIAATTASMAANAAATRAASASYSGFGGAVRQAAGANRLLVSSTGAVLSSGQQLAGRINNYTNAYAASSAAMARSAGQSAVQFGRFGSAVATIGQRLPVVAAMQQSFVKAATSAERFGRTAGTFSAAGAAVTSSMSGMSRAAGGVVGALGGPFGAALAGAGIALMAITSINRKSARSFEAVQDSIRATAKARAELGDALVKSRGAVTDDVKSRLDDSITEIDSALAAAASRRGSALDRVRAQGQSVFSWDSLTGSGRTGNGEFKSQADAIKDEADKAKDAQAAIDALKLSKQGLRDVAIGSQAAFDSFTKKLEAAGDGGRIAAEKFREMRSDFQKQQEAAKQLGPGMRELSTAFRTMGDATATASDKMSSLQAAMEALTPAASQAEAVGRYAEKVREVTAAASGIGAVKVKDDGTLDVFDVNSKKLADDLRSLATEAAGVAANGSLEDIQRMASSNAEAFRAWSAATGKPVAEIERLYGVYGGKAVELAIALKGAPEAAQSIALLATEFDRIPGRKAVTMETSQVESARGQIEKLGFSIKEVAGSNGQRVTISANTDEARAKLAEIQTILTSRIPSDKPVSVSAPGGQAVFDLLESMGVAVRKDNDKIINTGAPLAPAVLEMLRSLGIEVRQNNDKTITVRQVGAAETLTTLNGLKATIEQIPGEKRIRVTYDTSGVVPNSRPNPSQIPLAPGVIPNANGSITSYANGGIGGRLPSQAVMQRGRGRGLVQWAEGSTGVESFIPWASNKRGRSTMILSETARAFGYQLVRPGDFFQKFENGGISVEQLKTFASGIQGKKYTWGGGGNTFDADCSGAQSTIANFLTGATGRFATGNQGEALAARGFLQGDPPEGTAAYAIGWVNGGPGGGHTAGTIIDSDGSRINVEMGGAGGNGQYGGQAAAAASFPNRAYLPLQGQDMSSSGGSGASDDSSSSGGSGGGSGSGFGSLGSSIGAALFGSRSGGGTGGSGTSSKTTAATAKQLREAQDKVTDSEKAAAVAKQKVAELEANPKTKASALQAAKDRAEKTERDAKQAKTDLEALKAKGTGSGKPGDGKTGDSGSNTSEFQSLGQNLVSGMLQAIGLDGSLFSNPFEWPNVKSLFAGINYAGGLAKAVAGQSSENTGGLVGGAGAGLGLNIPNLADLAKPQTPQAPVGPGGALPLQGGGVTYDFRGANLGVNPKEMTQRIDSRQNAAFRRQSGALV
ncbi:hypothetical protein ACLQ3K_20130 [Tsukamurella sp. DT100]|uniref:hypothetical protein n=1 Tax=Tsukamurella sp. DT100 TaxID=3393415 RepID=UPI003CF511B9